MTQDAPENDRTVGAPVPAERSLLSLSGWGERRGRVRGAVLLILTAVVLGLLLARFDAAAVARALSRLPAEAWLGAAVLTALLPLTMTTRWHIVLGATGVAVPWRRCFVIMLGVHPISVVSPARLGDALRAYGLRRRGAGATALGGIVAERALDIAVLALAAALAGLSQGRGDVAVLAGLVVLVLVAVLALTARADRLPLRAGWRGALRRFAGAADVFRRRPGVLAAATGVTLLHWALTMLLVTLLLRGVGADVGLVQVTAAMPIAIFVGLLPITFAGIGTRDAALAVLLAGQAAPAQALAAGLLYTLFTYFFLALAGLPLTRRGLDL